MVTKDGQILKSTERTDGSGYDITDMNGKEITDERYIGGDSQNNIEQLVPIGTDLTKEAYYERLRLRTFMRSSQGYATNVEVSPYDTEAWYILHRQSYLVGYDKLSRRCVGFFDRDGFKPPSSVPVPFPDSPVTSNFSRSTPIFMTVGSRVYALDFTSRTMGLFFDAGKTTVYSAVRFNDGSGPAGRIAVATAANILIFGDTGDQILSLPYAHDPARWGYISIGTNRPMDRIYVEYDSTDLVVGKVSLPTFLEIYDLQGNLLHSYSIPGFPIQDTPPTWVNRVMEYSAPLCALPITSIYLRLAPPSPYEPSAPLFIGASPAALGAFALALAVLMFLWARRMEFSSRSALGWAVFVFAFGPIGLLTFRLATDWPVRLGCPACGRKRSIEGTECSHCHQGWTEPERNGTEILDVVVLGGH
jgi:hypothetical protein